MEGKIQALIRAGALRQICLYHSRRRGVDIDWRHTAEYAAREFRDLDPVTLSEFIIVCKQVYDETSRYMLGMVTKADLTITSGD